MKLPNLRIPRLSSRLSDLDGRTGIIINSQNVENCSGNPSLLPGSNSWTQLHPDYLQFPPLYRNLLHLYAENNFHGDGAARFRTLLPPSLARSCFDEPYPDPPFLPPLLFLGYS